MSGSRPVSAVTEFHRLAFPDADEAARWADGLLYRLGTAEGAEYRTPPARIVVWVPHGRGRRAPAAVFLSRAALAAARGLGLPVADTAKVPLALLPAGLALLVGDRADFVAYTDRRRRFTPGGSRTQPR